MDEERVGRWTLHETIILLNALEQEFGARLAYNYEARATTETSTIKDSFENVAAYMREQGVTNRSGAICRIKFTKLSNQFNKIQEWSQTSNVPYSSLTSSDHQTHKLHSMHLDVLKKLRSSLRKAYDESEIDMQSVPRSTQGEAESEVTPSISTESEKEQEEGLSETTEDGQDGTESMLSDPELDEAIAWLRRKPQNRERAAAISYMDTESETDVNYRPRPVQDTGDMDENALTYDARCLHSPKKDESKRASTSSISYKSMLSLNNAGNLLSSVESIQEKQESHGMLEKRRIVEKGADALIDSNLVQTTKKRSSGRESLKMDVKAIVSASISEHVGEMEKVSKNRGELGTLNPLRKGEPGASINGSGQPNLLESDAVTEKAVTTRDPRKSARTSIKTT